MSTDEPMDALSVVTREAMQLRTRLTEATALLERIVKYAREDRATTKGVTRLARVLAEVELDFLRKIDRAPAQLAAPMPEPGTINLYDALANSLRQPAAPTPECPYVGRCNSSRCPIHGEPAAPEPSAEVDILNARCSNWRERALTAEARAEAQLGYATGQAQREAESNAVLRADLAKAEAQLAALKQQFDKERIEANEAVVQQSEIYCDMQQRWLRERDLKQAAEAQLAAVRRWVDGCPDNRPVWQHCQALKAIRALLTPAPSPGAGEKSQ